MSCFGRLEPTFDLFSQIPFTRATINTHYDPLNLVFRLILPEVLTFLAVLFVRFWPPAYVAHLQGTDVRPVEPIVNPCASLQQEHDELIPSEKPFT